MDILVPQYAVVDIVGNVPMNGRMVRVVGHRNRDTGRLHMEHRPSTEPALWLAGVGGVDENELSEIAEWAKENTVQKWREKRGYPSLSAEDYRNKLKQMAEARLLRAKGHSVVGPHHRREHTE